MKDGAFDSVIRAIHDGRSNVRDDSFFGKIHPAAHLASTFAFLLILASFGKYSLSGVAGMCAYPLSLALFGNIPIWRSLSKIKYALLPVLLVGVANPFFDSETAVRIGTLEISGGWLSFSVLCVKGVLALLSGWSLLRLIGVGGLVQAFSAFRLPAYFGFGLELLHRHLLLLVKETRRMREAYQLRSGGARALKPAAWGSFAGLLLLRAADRATRVQEAVVLRGYRPEMSICRQFANDGVAAAGWMWFVFWLAYFVFVRMFDPVGVLGGLFLQLWF